jgi:hypothetical protein
MEPARMRDLIIQSIKIGGLNWQILYIHTNFGMGEDIKPKHSKLRKMRGPKCPLFVPYCGMKTRGAYWVPGWLYGNPAGWPGMIPGHPWFYIDVRLCCVYLGCGCRDIFPYIFEYVEYSQNWMVENAGNSNFLCSKHQKTMLTWFPLDWSMKYSKQPRLSRDESIGKSC